MDGTCSTHGRDEIYVQHFSRETLGKRPLARSRRRWEDNIKIGVKEIGWKGVDWIYLAQKRDQWWALANTVMNHRVP